MSEAAERVVSRLLKGVLHGAGWGAIIVLVGYGRRSMGFGSRPTEPFVEELLLGLAMGATIGPLIVLLQPLGRRGGIWHYVVWMVACICGCCAILLVLDRSYDYTTWLFGSFIGFCMGLALATITRKAATT